MRHHAAIALGAILALTAAAPSAVAASKEVDAANAKYRQGNYEEALETYARLVKESPENATLHFNRGAALFQLGMIDEARASFQEARLLSEDPALQAHCAYNLGNCAFQSAEEKVGEDPEQAIAALHQSVAHYKDALSRNRNYTEAAHNLETARRVIKQLEEQVQQQQEEQQHQNKELKEKLDELIEEQEQQNQQSQDAAQRQQDPSQPDPAEQEMDQLSQQQEGTREKTEELSEEMDAKSEGSASPMDEARDHTKAAAEKQQEAEEHLENQDAQQANEAQEEALEKLKEARKALGDGDDSEEEAEAEKGPGDGSEQEGEGTMESVPPPNDTAQDILAREKQLKEMRKIQQMKRIRPVEKDW